MILTFSSCAGCLFQVGRLLQLQASHLHSEGDEGREGMAPSSWRQRPPQQPPLSSWPPGVPPAAGEAGTAESGLAPPGFLGPASTVRVPVALPACDSQKGLQILPEGGQTPLQHGKPGSDQAGFVALGKLGFREPGRRGAASLGVPYWNRHGVRSRFRARLTSLPYASPRPRRQRVSFPSYTRRN